MHLTTLASVQVVAKLRKEGGEHANMLHAPDAPGDEVHLQLPQLVNADVTISTACALDLFGAKDKTHSR